MDSETRQMLADELQSVLADTFKLRSEDIKKYITKILDEKDEEAVWALTDFFLKFKKYNVDGVYSLERSKASKEVVNRAIKMYYTNKERIQDHFFVAMDFAQKQGIDPIQVATMENLRKLTRSIYENTYNTLTKVQYEDPITGQMLTLYNDAEFKELIENCASAICKVNENVVGEVYSILSIFGYDKENKTYYVSKNDAKDMMKRCGTLLTFPPERLKENIEFLRLHFIPPMTSAELVCRISKSPSILTIDKEKINKFEDCIFENLTDLRATNPALFPQGKEFEEFARKYARESTFNIEKLSSINGLNKDNLKQFSKVKDILVKYLGPKNAFETFTDFNVLSTDPQVLDALLEKFVQFDKENNSFKMRTFFIKHPASALNILQSDQPITSTSFQPAKRAPRKPKEVDVSSMPTDAKSNAYLTSSEKAKVENLFENAKSRLKARTTRKVVDGVEQLSEEEQEEKDYWQEIFDRLQDDFDASKCTSAFDEILSRTEMTIDAKKGKGYADKTFKISEMKALYSKYLELCKGAEPYAESFFKYLEKLCDCERKAKNIKGCTPNYYFSTITETTKIGNEFFDSAFEVDKIMKKLLVEVLYKGEKIVKDLKIPSNRFEKFCFDRSLDKNGIIKLFSFSVLFVEYANFLAENADKIIGYELENKKFSDAYDNFLFEKIAVKDMYYCLKFRELAVDKICDLIDPIMSPINEIDPTSNYNIKLRRSASQKYVGYSVLNPMNHRPLGFENIGGDDIVSLAMKANNFALRRILSDEGKKFIDMCRRGVGKFAYEADYYDGFYTTHSGVCVYCKEKDKSVAIFFDEPNMDKAKFENVGVKPIPEDLAKEVGVITNSRNNEMHYTDDDLKSMAPLKPTVQAKYK